MDITAAQAANLTVGLSVRESELHKLIDRALRRIGKPPLTYAENAALHDKVNEGFAAEVREAGTFDPDECFLYDTSVQMWPLDPWIKPRADGSYDEELVLSK